ncbi:hypothetical protein NLX62_04365 [Mycobacteriaceae bacterium Msp059]|nr:hypothetical protein [Mycobacteriaceae bacterium Msp059]
MAATEVGTRIDVREPTDDAVGCVSARIGGEFGPEICFAVGRGEFGDWYISLNKILFDVAGIEPQPIHVAAGRGSAEALVRLFAALYERARSAANGEAQAKENDQCGRAVTWPRTP